MATCPHCLGALTEDHRCPRGRFSRVASALLPVLIGAVLGFVVVFVVQERPAVALVLAGSALGAVLATAVRQAIGRRM